MKKYLSESCGGGELKDQSLSGKIEGECLKCGETNVVPKNKHPVYCTRCGNLLTEEFEEIVEEETEVLEPYSKKEKICIGILIGFCVIFAIVSGVQGYTTTKEWGTRNDVIKEAGEWIDSNLGDELLFVPDQFVYKFFTEKRLVSSSKVYPMLRNFVREYPDEDYLKGYALIFKELNVTYFIAWDSTMPWFFESTMGQLATTEDVKLNFSNHEVDFIFVRTFETNQANIILYKVEVEE